MKLDEETKKYLDGELFSTGYKLKIVGEFRERSRLEYIRKQVEGTRVLHIGCVDHAPSKVVSKLKRGVWLHQILLDSASFCAGVDLNREGIDFLKNEMNMSAVYCNDILTDVIPGVSDASWDYIVLGELLEHVDDPVDFLRTLRQRPGLQNAKCIVTVPNAFYYKNFKNALKQIENINSDHRYWFTPYTLSKVLVMAGWQVEEIQLTQDGTFKLFPIIPYFLFTRYPLLRSKVVAIASQAA